jgi:hypothetical protein
VENGSLPQGYSASLASARKSLRAPSRAPAALHTRLNRVVTGGPTAPRSHLWTPAGRLFGGLAQVRAIRAASRRVAGLLDAGPCTLRRCLGVTEWALLAAQRGAERSRRAVGARKAKGPGSLRRPGPCLCVSPVCPPLSRLMSPEGVSAPVDESGAFPEVMRLGGL